jgi:Asp-tRNA(Asn)/Glu-tRNA(Gln) amidotransferase A subunit family amidase
MRNEDRVEGGTVRGAGRPAGAWPRRRVLQVIGAAGVGSAVFGRALVALAAGKGRVSGKMIRQAEWIAGVDLTPEERGLMLKGINELLEDFETVRAVELDNSVPPALYFSSDPGRPPGPAAEPDRRPEVPRSDPGPLAGDDLAYAPVAALAARIRAGRLSSTELTRLYLERLRRHDPVLRCVISYTEDLALRQADRADRDLAAGDYRGALHGIPWGAKDILAVPGYRTTWGAMPYKDQRRDGQAAVVTLLEQAGSVLLAKLSVGALAWGDVWYGGTTKNPWNTEQGSSGSSAGSAAATAAGCVGFAIGTETWGSIVSPCTRCGATGLRPTFGRVSRAGTMALSWSMDKIGPITRSVEDCALVFGAILGSDPGDPATVDRPFRWPFDRDPTELRVGYVESLFDEDRTASAEDDKGKADLREWQEFDRRTLDALRRIGFRLRPVKLPEAYPVSPLALILTAEAATAFDDLTRSGRDDLLVRQVEMAWPNVFRQGQMIPAVEYIRANRIRTLILRAMERMFEEIDVYVCPSYGGSNLLLTNLTGHPSVVVPNGFRSSDGTPTSITFLGRLFGESELLAVADRYQKATDFHLRRPPLEG